MGFDPKTKSITGVTAGKGKGGGGFGVNAGVDVCYTWVNCTPCSGR
jgi:hypothetical protein